MCIRITERYAVCGCIYYVHGIDQCQSVGQAGHSIQERTVLVGYACSTHSAGYSATASYSSYSSQSSGSSTTSGGYDYSSGTTSSLGVLPDAYSSSYYSSTSGYGYR